MEAYVATPYGPETVELISRVKRIFSDLVVITPNKISNNHRSTLLALYTSLGVEHFRAILLLVESRAATGSAFALFRPLLEAVTRGEWLYLCGTDADRTALIEGKLVFDGLRQLCAAVDAKVGKGRWLENYAQSYTHFCDFTHGGVLAIGSRLLSGDAIQPSYDEGRVRLLLENAVRMIVLHFSILAELDGEAELSERYAGLFAILRA